MASKQDSSTRTVLTVSELNGSARLLLSSHFGSIWVEGEVSNLSQPSSGHLYFTLKDADAQVRCAMFRGSARSLRFRPEPGMHVLVQAQVSLYEPRGDYQLIVDYMEEAGDGALRRAFEKLKAQLDREGLFAQERKKPIPLLPGRIGVITSPSGAAIHDILSVLRRRFPALPVLIFPVTVQGASAKSEIARAIALADELRLCDLLILARGGGSLEDLWPFNEELVARAMAACTLPIIAGIGHESDLTIADLVADLRAPTPSAAAEAASPDGSEWLARFGRLEARLSFHWRAALRESAQRLRFLDMRRRQAHPWLRLQRLSQRLDELDARFQSRLDTLLHLPEARLLGLQSRLHRQAPQLPLMAAKHQELNRRLLEQGARIKANRQERLASLAAQLQAISPLATLDRGYSITTLIEPPGTILRKPDDASPGDLIETRLAVGRLLSRVESLG